MTVAVQPPRLLPGIAYFDLLRKADLFILLDRTRFDEEDPPHRARIQGGRTGDWLAVPLLEDPAARRLSDIRINNRASNPRWGRRLALALRRAYIGTPFFTTYAPALEEILSARWERLVDLDRELMTFVSEALGIRKPVILSSGLHAPGHGSRLLLKLCQLTGADRLLDGGDLRPTWADTLAFLQAGVRVVPQEFRHPTYEQRNAGSGFVEGLSAVDLLFHRGPDSADVLDGRALEHAGYAE